MTRHEHLLTILMEECAETAQRASKMMRFGVHEKEPGQKKDNFERLSDETNDLLGIISLLQEEGLLMTNDQATLNKVLKIEKYLKYSGKCGTLNSR